MEASVVIPQLYDADDSLAVPDPPNPWQWWSDDSEMLLLMETPFPEQLHFQNNSLSRAAPFPEDDQRIAPNRPQTLSRMLPRTNLFPHQVTNCTRPHQVVAEEDVEKEVHASSVPFCVQCRYCRRPFVCSLERPSSASNKLERHEIMCGKRHCGHCCALFRTALECQGHIRLCANNMSYHRCEFCTARLKNVGEKRCHEATCELNPALCCEHCGRVFNHTALRNRHMRACPRDPRRLCVFCGEKFPSRADVVSHEVCCNQNPSTHFKEGECAACSENRQVLSFPCDEHCYCAPCLSKMLQVGIKDRSLLPLRCCKKFVEIGDSVDISLAAMLPEASRLKYQEAMTLHGAHLAMYCPSIKCGILIILDALVSHGQVTRMRHGWHTEVDLSEEISTTTMLSSSPIGCPRCQQAICFKCRSEWHEGVNCAQYQYFASKVVDEVTKFCRKMNWMRCFECGHVVEKKAGCNHITCICGSNFCYLCGAKWGTCKCQIVGDGHALRHNRGAAAATHTCQHCSQHFDSREELRVHLALCQAAQANAAFECATCRARFTDYGQYREHRRQCVAARTELRQYAAEDLIDARRAQIRRDNESRPP